MSDLRNQLLSSPSRTPFEDKYEAIKNLLLTVTSKNDKFFVLVDAEKNQATLREAKFYYGDVKDSLNDLKEMLISLEKMTRGMEQRNKTKKLRDLYTKELERHSQIYKNIQQQCSEDQRDGLKGLDAGKASNNGTRNVAIFYEKFDQDGTVKAKGFMQQQQQTDGIQLEHIDWQNQIIKENQHELNHIEERSMILNKIVLDVSQEVDRQDGELDIISTNMTSSHANVIHATKDLLKVRGTQTGGTKKYIAMMICMLAVSGIIVGSVFLFK